ncbi:hypothetical protein BKP35_17655 [Anaerobacillus arseniciselenatis]|uniref:Circadian input-output histidine kinase CikA n=1 Tax=Anaerobacillus arseniciselenatis TaxID=85682 RepID=A0A1S2L8A4_9BACI|nr:response regulator [Anaerobacillus arseniciselenatis]OIJ08544.1 hypothetical protein BKP35_17655 [Anaerobacillus arseniciselenatis]
MKLKTKLFIGLGTVLVVLLLISANVFYTFNNKNKNMNYIMDEYFERVRLANLLESNTLNTARLTRDLILMETNELNENYLVSIEAEKESSILALETLSNLTADDPKAFEVVNELQFLLTNYYEVVEATVEKVKIGNFETARVTLLEDNAEMRYRIADRLDHLTTLEEASMEQALENSVQSYQNTITFFLLSAIACFILVLSIIFILSRSISKSINRVRNVMRKLPHNSFENLPRMEVTKDEFGEVATAYNEMAVALENFSSNEKNYKKSLEEENWVKTKFGDLATKIQRSQKLEAFGNLFLTNLAPNVEAAFGAFYFQDENKKSFSEIASYAANAESNLGKKCFQLGEGLVGQCAADNEIIVLEKVPEGYIDIKSGLGSATPTSLIIIPIEFDDKVIGVLELAKFSSFTPLQRRLLEQVCNSIGPNLNRITNHMEIARLLSESQTLTEELQTQSEELQQQQEELRTINEELHEENRRTEEKSNELEIIKEDLEHKNREVLLSSKYKSEFLANMSHELRTPLNSMLILSQILAENDTGNLQKKQVEYAQTIHSSGKDLLNLINDILDLAKVESGKVEVYPEQLQLNDIKAFVERQFSPVSKYKGLDFDIVIDKNAPSTIFTDDQRLKQILKNLLSNAFKFTNKGSVTLSVEPGTKETNSKMIFSVVDTGIGIAKDKQNLIFEAFSQVDGTTSRKFGGTGLGLSISRELSQLLGGYVTVESVENEGSTFSLYLPDYENNQTENASLLVAATEEEQLMIEEAPSQISDDNLEQIKDSITEDVNEDLENKNVLIVDDDMRNVFALTSALERQNMNVIFAENGNQAIDILSDKNVDIVLMDIMMPEMDGYEAMTKIRNNDQLKDLPIIALTAKAMKHDREKCITAGATDYISKPVDMEQLLSLIKIWVQK